MIEEINKLYEDVKDLDVILAKYTKSKTGIRKCEK